MTWVFAFRMTFVSLVCFTQKREVAIELLENAQKVLDLTVDERQAIVPSQKSSQ